MGGKVGKSAETPAIQGTAYIRRYNQSSDWYPASGCQRHKTCVSSEEICNWSIDQDYLSSFQCSSLYSLTTDNPIKDVATFTSVSINCTEQQIPCIVYKTLRESSSTLISLAIRGLPVGCRVCIYEFFRQIPINEFSALKNLTLSRKYMDQCSVGLDIIEFPISLTHLTLHGIGIISIPKWLTTLTELEHLCLSNNVLTGFDDVIKSRKLLKLTILDFSKNRIAVVPSELSSLPRLQVLDLSHNLIKECVPAEIGQCTSLIEIYLEWNRLGSIPTDAILQLNQLKMLDLSYNKLKKISLRILFHPSLAYLNLSGNENITYVDDVEDNATTESEVEELDVSNTNLYQLPAMFAKLVKLKVLNCDNNHLSDISELSGLTNLQLISLKSNNIESLDTFPNLLSGLRFRCTIDLAKNGLTEVPDFLSQYGSVQFRLSDSDTAESDAIPGSGQKTKSLLSRVYALLSRNAMSNE